MVICKNPLKYSNSAGTIKKEKAGDAHITLSFKEASFWPVSLKPAEQVSVMAAVVYKVLIDKLYTNTLLEICVSEHWKSDDWFFGTVKQNHLNFQLCKPLKHHTVSCAHFLLAV